MATKAEREAAAAAKAAAEAGGGDVPENQAMVIADTDGMSVAEMAHALALSGLGEGWEVIVSGSVPYWNPSPKGGEVLAGELLRRQEITANVNGKPMQAFLYMIKIMAPCRANAITPDGEPIVAEAGEIVSVIERTILRELREHVGKEVAIFCDGKGTNKAGQPLWRFRVAGKPVKKTVTATAETSTPPAE